MGSHFVKAFRRSLLVVFDRIIVQGGSIVISTYSLSIMSPAVVFQFQSKSGSDFICTP